MRRESCSYGISESILRKKKGPGQPAMNRSKQAGMGKAAIGVLMLSLALVTIRLAEAQPGKVPRIAYLHPGPAAAVSARMEAFRQGLRELGYIEGKNIAIEYLYADGETEAERLPDLAAELVRLRVDVIVALDSVAIRPAMEATKTIPIVMAVSGDPVEVGLIDSLARPGGNITGLSNVSPQLAGKRNLSLSLFG
jgi:putative ABC transport system substrate-binding protein